MFDQLFRYPGVVRRHRDGPLAHERATYLASLATRGAPPGTLLKYARYCLAIAHVVPATPHERSFTASEIDILAQKWAADRVQHRRAAAPRWPHEHFRAIATDFLKSLGRWIPPPKTARPYAREVDDFVTVEQRDRLRSASTCHIRRWQIEQFLSYLTQTHCDLAAVTPQHLDTYFQHAAQRWSRVGPEPSECQGAASPSCPACQSSVGGCPAAGTCRSAGSPTTPSDSRRAAPHTSRPSDGRPLPPPDWPSRGRRLHAASAARRPYPPD